MRGMDGQFFHAGTVAFADTDAAGFAHFTRVLQWVEVAEAAWLADMGVGQFTEQPGGQRRGFPKLAVHCDYRRPLRCGEAFRVQLSIQTVGETTLTYRFTVLTGKSVAAEGTITLIHAELPAGDLPRKLPLPEVLRQTHAAQDTQQQ